MEEVVFGKEPGEWGRPTGEAYVRFGSKQEAEKALRLNGQHIGSRYGWLLFHKKYYLKLFLIFY